MKRIYIVALSIMTTSLLLWHPVDAQELKLGPPTKTFISEDYDWEKKGPVLTRSVRFLVSGIASSNAAQYKITYTLICNQVYNLTNGVGTSINCDTIISEIEWRKIERTGVKIIENGSVPPIGNPAYVIVPGGSVAKITAGRSEPDTTKDSRPHEQYNKVYMRRSYDGAMLTSGRTYIAICFSYLPAFSYRNIGVQTTAFQYPQGYNERIENERPVFGQSFNLSIGFTISNRSTICLEGFQQTTGFRNDSASLNWITGATVAAPGNEFRFKQSGLGVIYRISGYGKSVNVASEIGVFGTKLETFSSDFSKVASDGDIRGMNLRLYGVTAKAGLGLCFHPDFRYEIRIMPTAYFNLTSIDKGATLRTYPYNLGLSFGLNWRFLL